MHFNSKGTVKRAKLYKSDIEAYSEPCQPSKMERLVKTVNG